MKQRRREQKPKPFKFGRTIKYNEDNEEYIERLNRKVEEYFKKAMEVEHDYKSES